MSRRLLVASLLLVIIPVPLRAADELYDLRGPAPEKGQIYLLTSTSSGKDQVRVVKIGDKVQRQVFDEEALKKKEVEVLGVSGYEITKLRTKVTEDKREEVLRRKKREQRVASDREMRGQIIYSERTAKGWKSSLEDVTPTDRQKRLLEEFVPFKEEDLFYPAGKVKVGHEWKIDLDAFKKVLGQQMEDFKGTGTGKFLRVEKVDGEETAVLEIEFDISGKTKDDEMTMDVSIKGKSTVQRTLKLGVDRKSTSVVTMSMKGQGEDEGQKIEFEFNGTTNDVDTVELKK